ncbi:MAG: SCO1664 family protein [Jatrophihabitantaceae bacterium]
MDELTAPVAMPVADALTLLECGEISVEGRVVSASNATLYCRIEFEAVAAACVYKPISGERPLWDYPDGTLAEREVACYQISAATGWDIVPPTVLRAGPLGTGMVQLWVAEEESFDMVAAINNGGFRQLQRIALLDAVLNNSDRKISHLLPVIGDGNPEQALHIYGVDHGVSLGVQNRLRTVLWQWAGDPIPAEGLDVLGRLDTDWEVGSADRPSLSGVLSELLTTAEVRAVRRRVRRLLGKQRFPMPPTDWPAIPYPPY